MTQNDISVLGATRIAVGLSAIIRVKPSAYWYAEQFKIVGGSTGTLEIVQAPAALTGSGATGWGAGYPVGLTEVMNVQGPATFYLASSGETMTIGMMIGYSAGATVV